MIWSFSLQRYFVGLKDFTSMLSRRESKSLDLPFIDLSMQENVITWLEVRGYQMLQVQSLFAKIEVMIFYMFVLYCVTFGVGIHAVIKNQTAYMIEIATLFIVQAIYVKALITTSLKFQKIQQLQEEYIIEQKLQIACQDSEIASYIRAVTRVDSLLATVQMFHISPKVFTISLRNLTWKTVLGMAISALPVVLTNAIKYILGHT